MYSTRILLLCISAAVFYGVIHDQVTTRLCLEYFTVAHPPLITSTSPTVVAFFWGFAATWWVGVLLGIPLALAARAGARPRLCASDLVRPIAILLLCMAASALMAGVAGYTLASQGVITMGDWRSLIADSKEAAFMACVFAHGASYLVGLLGGVVLIGLSWRRRVGSLKEYCG